MISPDALDKLLKVLRERLINEVTNASCPKCGKSIYSRFYKNWDSGHVPYYEIGDTVMVGYRCPKSGDPIVVFKIPLSNLIMGFKGERGSTWYLE